MNKDWFFIFILRYWYLKFFISIMSKYMCFTLLSSVLEIAKMLVWCGKKRRKRSCKQRRNLRKKSQSTQNAKENKKKLWNCVTKGLHFLVQNCKSLFRSTNGSFWLCCCCWSTTFHVQSFLAMFYLSASFAFSVHKIHYAIH